MNKFLCLILFSIIACSKAKPSSSPLEKVPFIDTSRLSGEWTIVAHIPTVLDKEGIDMRAQFESASDKPMKVTWTFRKSASDDHETSWSLNLSPGSAGDSSVWKVSPFWPLNFTYFVTEFSADYSWFVLASGDRRYLWILSRDKQMDPGLLNGLIQRLEKSEFDIGAIVKQKEQAAR